MPESSWEVSGEPAWAWGPPPAHAGLKNATEEHAWHRKLCHGQLTLKRAQKLELAYKRAHG
jgi:hypothetical protein